MLTTTKIAFRSLLLLGILSPLVAVAQKGTPTSSIAPSPTGSVAASPAPSVSPAPSSVPSGVAGGKSEETDLLAARFGRAGEGKYLIPLGSVDPVPRFTAAYCPKSGRHAVRYLREQKGKPDVSAEDIEVPWSSVPGSVYQVEGAPLADEAESGCLLVTEDFEKSHTLLKAVSVTGVCNEAVAKAVRTLRVGSLKSCKLRSRIGDSLLVEFMVENSDSGVGASSMQYLGVYTAGGIGRFADSEPGELFRPQVGPFFRTQDGRVRFLLIWEQTESSSIPWTLEEVTPGRTRTLIELDLYNQAGG